MTESLEQHWLDHDMSYDPDTHRAIHVPTGMAVQWLRDDPPMERRAFFKLDYNGKDTPFAASYDYADAEKRLAFPGLSESERWHATRHWKKINFVAGGYEFQMLGLPPCLFLKVWHHQLHNQNKGYLISTSLNLPHEKASWTYSR